MKKLVLYLVGIAIMGLIGEGGYYLGVKTGKQIGLQTSSKIVPPPVIPIGNESTSQWVRQINNLPSNVLWKSDWTIGLLGELISIDDNSITLNIYDSPKQLAFPIPIKDIENVKFSKYDQVQKKYLPNSITLNEFKTGDKVGLNVSVETINGKIKDFELVKQIVQ